LENPKIEIGKKTVNDYSLMMVCLFFLKRIYHRLTSITLILVYIPLLFQNSRNIKLISGAIIFRPNRSKTIIIYEPERNNFNLYNFCVAVVSHIRSVDLPLVRFGCHGLSDSYLLFGFLVLPG
jgi:hypothetical protein